MAGNKQENELIRKQRNEQMEIQAEVLATEQKSAFKIGSADHTAMGEDTISATKQSMRFISEAFDNQELMLSDETKAALMTRQRRSSSHILLNSTKLFGDSKEMKAIKDNLAILEDYLVSEVSSQKDMESLMAKIQDQYGNTIDTCRHYLSVKTTRTRSDRYTMVRDKMFELMEEMSYIQIMRDKIEAGDSQVEGIYCPYNLLTLARLQSEFPKAVSTEVATVQEVKRDVSTDKDYDDTLGNVDYMAQNIINMLRLKSTPRDITSKAGSDEAGVAVWLCNLLRNFPEGEHMTYVHTGFAGFKGGKLKRTYKQNGKDVMCDTLIGLKQAKDGTLTLIINGAKLVLPYAKDAIISSMQGNLIGNEDIFGREFTDSSVNYINQLDPNDSTGMLRNLCLKIIGNRTGIRPVNFDNVSTQEIKSLTLYYLRGELGKTEIQDYISTIEKEGQFKRKEVKLDGEANEVEDGEDWVILEKVATASDLSINGDETLEMLRYRGLQEKKELAKKVSLFKPEKRETVTVDDSDGWTGEERAVRNLIADMVYSRHTWDADAAIEKPGERFRKILLDNTDAVVYVLKDKSLLTGMVDKLPIPSGKEKIREGIDAAFAQLEDAIRQNSADLLSLDMVQMINSKLLKEAISLALSVEAVAGKFAEVEDSINEAVNAGSDEIQKYISENVDMLFGGETAAVTTTEDETQIPNHKFIQDPEEKKRCKELGRERLKKYLKDAVTGNSGQGKFIKLIMQHYFSEVSTLDKRSMMGAALRDARAMEGGADASEEQVKKAAGAYLGGIFKGAGPLLQKILQGIPSDGMPEELKGAFEDVKSNLLPIPDEIVEAQMLAMVERSNGEVTKIEVTRTLGAASVGQAFLCKLYGPSFPQTGEEVVVKLLRPDVHNRMMREKGILLRCANQTDAGMRKTYEGQLARIEEELDLTIEARNVELGQIYSKSKDATKTEDGVVSMRLNKVIAPTTGSMVIEKAPGTTVDKYLKELDAQEREILEPLYVYEEVNGKRQLVLEDGVPKIDCSRVSIARLIEIASRIREMHNTASTRQKHLIRLSEKWVDEGLFQSGFYHGDLHAGNIMITDEKATVIDFGNATQLEEEQKVQVTRMMAATAVSDAEMFMEAFHNLMSKEPSIQQTFKDKQAEFLAMLKKILELGTGSNSGERIGVALIKAQELGLELPSAIFNFSQCQLRLQNTVDSMNHHLDTMYKQLQKITDNLGGMQVDRELEVADIVRLNCLLSKHTPQEHVFISLRLNSDVTTKMLSSGSPEDLKVIEDCFGPYFDEFDSMIVAKQDLISEMHDKILEIRENLKDENYHADRKTFEQKYSSIMSIFMQSRDKRQFVDSIFDKTVPMEVIEEKLNLFLLKPSEIFAKIKAQAVSAKEQGTEINGDKLKNDAVCLASLFMALSNNADQRIKLSGEHCALTYMSTMSAAIKKVFDGCLNGEEYVIGEKQRDELKDKFKPYIDDPRYASLFNDFLDKHVAPHSFNKKELFNTLVDMQNDLIYIYVRIINDLQVGEDEKLELSIDTKQDDFIDVMGKVIVDNLMSTMKRVGARWATKHAKDMQNLD